MSISQAGRKRSTRESIDPRHYIGPRRFGYPPVRRSRLDDLEERVEGLERALAQAGLHLAEEWQP
jgi:hypothetical protein